MEPTTLSEAYAKPWEWPMWPYLPVKNRTKKDPLIPGFPLTGLMVEGSAKVFDANLFDRPIDLSKLHQEYPSAIAAEQDGWIVD